MSDTTPTFDSQTDRTPNPTLHLDYAILSILCANDNDPIASTTRFHNYMYIAQVGGLHDDQHEPTNYDPTNTSLTFANTDNGAYSNELSQRLTFLETAGFITTTDYPTQHESTRTEYKTTPLAHDTLSTADTALTDNERSTLETVKTAYETVHKRALRDLTKHDYETRDTNNTW